MGPAVDFSWRKDCVTKDYVTLVEGLKEALTDSQINGSAPPYCGDVRE
jgi:hypothetical protein